MTAQIPCHVQNFVVIISTGFEMKCEQNEIISEKGPGVSSYMVIYITTKPFR